MIDTLKCGRPVYVLIVYYVTIGYIKKSEKETNGANRQLLDSDGSTSRVQNVCRTCPPRAVRWLDHANKEIALAPISSTAPQPQPLQHNSTPVCICSISPKESILGEKLICDDGCITQPALSRNY